MVLFDEIFIAEDNIKITNRENPKIYGVIYKESSPKRLNQIYAIKYYWNNKFQDIKYADDLEAAKKRLKDIIIHMSRKKIETSFEKFSYTNTTIS